MQLCLSGHFLWTTSNTISPFCDWHLSLGMTEKPYLCFVACLLFVVQHYSFGYVSFYDYRDHLGPLGHYRMLHLPTHTRPSTPTARPGGQSQRKDPSLLMQCPFMQMPGVWHSSTSAQRWQKLVHYCVTDFACWTTLAYQPFNWVTEYIIYI